jgi:hypothetical protein
MLAFSTFNNISLPVSRACIPGTAILYKGLQQDGVRDLALTTSQLLYSEERKETRDHTSEEGTLD